MSEVERVTRPMRLGDKPLHLDPSPHYASLSWRPGGSAPGANRTGRRRAAIPSAAAGAAGPDGGGMSATETGQAVGRRAWRRAESAATSPAPGRARPTAGSRRSRRRRIVRAARRCAAAAPPCAGRAPLVLLADTCAVGRKLLDRLGERPRLARESAAERDDDDDERDGIERRKPAEDGETGAFPEEINERDAG